MSKRYIVHTGDRDLEATVVEHEDGYELQIDGKTLRVDSRGGGASATRSLIIDGRAYEASTLPGRDGMNVYVSGDAFLVRVTDELWARAEAEAGTRGGGDENVVSPMPGSVVKILVAEGQTVAPGETVAVVEAMKMQNEITAVRGGTVNAVKVGPGDVVEQDTVLVVLAGDPES
jgi:biotin carboxyl carrier protein